MSFFINKKAFTLIEIMVVIGIMSLLAAIAIPQMLRSRMNANELAAIAGVRTINTSCQGYYNSVSPHSYPPNLTALNNTFPPYIDNVLANAVDINHSKQGYYFTFTPIDPEHFTIIAWPVTFGRTGARNFFVNELGAIYYNSQNGLAPVPGEEGTFVAQ